MFDKVRITEKCYGIEEALLPSAVTHAYYTSPIIRRR